MAESPPAEAPLASLPPDHPAQAYAGLPAPELLRYVQVAGANLDHPASQVIFTAFYHRYFRYLMTVVENSFGFLHDRSGIEEIVNDTLAAFFRASEKFDLSKARDAQGCDQLIRSYLGRLAKWKANNARSFQTSFGGSVPDHALIERELQAQSSTTPSAPSQDVSDMATWLAGLPERDRDVLRTYFLDDHPAQKSGRLPDGVATGLAARHGTTPENIRQIKRKLLQEIRARFQHLATR